jgi:GTP-binding protein HflX
LPPRLIQAFKSTLLESIHADLILHVVDASDPEIFEKIIVVDDILKDLDIDSSKQIYIFNKSDKISSDTKRELEENFKSYSPIFFSTKINTDSNIVFNEIIKKLN